MSLVILFALEIPVLVIESGENTSNSTRSRDPYFRIGVCVHAALSFIATLIAFLTARNRQIVQHKQWMVRSYVVTFSSSWRISEPQSGNDHSQTSLYLIGLKVHVSPDKNADQLT